MYAQTEPQNDDRIEKLITGKNKYLRLITFKAPSESGPIAVKAKKAIGP